MLFCKLKVVFDFPLQNIKSSTCFLSTSGFVFIKSAEKTDFLVIVKMQIKHAQSYAHLAVAVTQFVIEFWNSMIFSKK